VNNSSASTTATLVKGLGGASLGLGLSEIFAPAKVAGLAGIDQTGRSRSVIRALGIRECGHAAALLFGPAPLVWTRVAGDALDLSLLGAALAKRRQGGRRRGAASAVALAGIAAADLYAALRTTRNGDGRHANAPRHRTLRAAITVRRSPEEVYRYWRDLQNLPTSHLKSLTKEAQITDEEPNQRIAWQSLPGSAIASGGSVEFTPTPTGDGTEVRVTLSYHIPGGALGKAAATLLGESPEQQVNDDLRRFKQLLETGEILRSDGSPEGIAAIRQMHQRTAQPKAAQR
jgi:uncharacterized membrane protein